MPSVRGSVVQKIDIQRYAAIHPRAPLGLQRLGEGAQAPILPVRRKGDDPIDVVAGATRVVYGLTGLRDVQGRKRLAQARQRPRQGPLGLDVAAEAKDDPG